MKQAILKKPLALVLALLMVFSISATSIYYASAIDVNTVLTVERGGKVKDEYILDKFEKLRKYTAAKPKMLIEYLLSILMVKREVKAGHLL